MGIFDFTVENSTLASQPWKNGKTYWASFELYPEAKGQHFYCFKGAAYHEKVYWSETLVAVKTFRNIDAQADDWAMYKRKCDVARKHTNGFNKFLESAQCDAKVYFVKPIEAVMDNISDLLPLTRFVMRFSKTFSQDETVIFEDYLEGDFTTFVTNTGETTAAGSHILDAFSHYTYHASDGQHVVCNLKGIEEEGEFRLTNPVIHSVDRCYGDTDKSDIGINDFFKNHVCSSLCKDYAKPEIFAKPSAPQEPSAIDTDTKEPESETPERQQPSSFLGRDSLPDYTPTDPLPPPPYGK